MSIMDRVISEITSSLSSLASRVRHLESIPFSKMVTSINAISLTHRDNSAPTLYTATWSGLTDAISAFDPALDATITIPPVVIYGAEIQIDKNVRISGAIPGPQSDVSQLYYHCTLVGAFNVLNGVHFAIENCQIIKITVGDEATLTAKHCSFNVGGTSILVPDGTGTSTVIIDQSIVISETFAVESAKTAGTLIIQLINSVVSGPITLNEFVDLQIYAGTSWDQLKIQKNSPYWSSNTFVGGFLTTTRHDSEHAEDISTGVLVRHTPRPTALGSTLVSDGTGWVESFVGLFSFISNEEPAGSKDGLNTVFRTANPFIASSLSVYVNGLKRQPTEEFVEVPTDQLELAVPPASTDIILVSYRY